MERRNSTGRRDRMAEVSNETKLLLRLAETYTERVLRHVKERHPSMNEKGEQVVAEALKDYQQVLRSLLFELENMG